MTIDKAIEILSHPVFLDNDTFDKDYQDAFKLGIEALKGIRQVREQFPQFSPFPLSGETEE